MVIFHSYEKVYQRYPQKNHEKHPRYPKLCWPASVIRAGVVLPLWMRRPRSTIRVLEDLDAQKSLEVQKNDHQIENFQRSMNQRSD